MICDFLSSCDIYMCVFTRMTLNFFFLKKNRMIIHTQSQSCRHIISKNINNIKNKIEIKLCKILAYFIYVIKEIQKKVKI
jgi:hypothetical protein